jgi:hypothetical protein
VAQSALDPFAQFDTSAPAAAPTNDNVASPGAVSQALIPNYDPSGQWIGYRRAPGAPGPETANQAPVIVAPATERANFQDTVNNLLGATLAPRTEITPPTVTKPPVVAASTPASAGAPAAAIDPFAAFDHLAPPATAAAPAPVTPGTTGIKVATEGTPAPAAAPTEPFARQELRQQPWYQPLWDAATATNQAMKGLGDVASHAATFGLDEIVAPLPAAVARSMTTGEPFSQAYDHVVQMQRQEREAASTENPKLAALASLAGGGVSAPVTAPLFAGAPATTLAGKAVNAIRNVGAGALTGGISAGLETPGDVQQRLEAARAGAEFGGALSAAAPLITSATGYGARALTAGRPATQERIAGQALRETAGLQPGQPPPVPEQPAVPGMPLGAGPAMVNPGLAAQERVLNTTQDAGRQAEIEAQNAATRAYVFQRTPLGSPVLANSKSVPEASRNVVTSLQRAHSLLKAEEERLWTVPRLTGNQPDVAAVKQSVSRAITSLPQRIQNAIAKDSDLGRALDDLANMPRTASLADLNSVRSDILAAGRALPYDQRFAKKAADEAAKAVLNGIESNPSLRNDPAAWAAYQKAREFTRSYRTALGSPQFQKMLQAVEGNTKGLDAGKIATSLFDLGAGTERTPEGVARVADLLDGIRKQWGALQAGNAGVPMPGLSPAAAFGARTELTQAYRDLVTNAILDNATSITRDIGGNQRLLWNRLSDVIDTNRDWMVKSGVFKPDQINVLDRIKEGAVQAQRLENLRGGTNSATQEYLKNADRYIDVFVGPVIGRTVGTVGGAIAGGIATQLFGENAIGSMIGAEMMGGGASAGHAGHLLLQKLFQTPRDKVIDLINQAIRDPDLAHDLMARAGQRTSPKFKQWVRSWLSAAPSNIATTVPGGLQ